MITYGSKLVLIDVVAISSRGGRHVGVQQQEENDCGLLGMEAVGSALELAGSHGVWTNLIDAIKHVDDEELETKVFSFPRVRVELR